jgi:hypothetical protein
MSSRPGWREVFKGKGDPLGLFLALVVCFIVANMLQALLGRLLESILPSLLVLAIFLIPGILAGGLTYYILVRLRKKA